MNHSAFPCHKAQSQLSSSFWQIPEAEHKISNKKWDNTKFHKNNIREFPRVLNLTLMINTVYLKQQLVGI